MATLVIVLDDAGRVVNVAQRDEQGLIDSLKDAKKIADVVKAFRKFDPRSFFVDDAVRTYSLWDVEHSTTLTDQQRADFRALLLDKSLFDHLEVVADSTFATWKVAGTPVGADGGQGAYGTVIYFVDP